MAKIRTIKPALARHRELFEAEKETGLPLRYVWALFPTVCDKAGRFLWKPWEIKLDIMPYDADVDFSRVMDALATRGFLVRYALAGVEYGCIPTFLKHQVPNNKERASQLPGPDDDGVQLISVSDSLPTREPRVSHARVELLGKPSVEMEYGSGNGTGNGNGIEGSAPVKPAAPAEANPNTKVWQAYEDAYFHRYGVEPIRNAKVNSAISQFVKRVGAVDAPDIVRFYVSHNGSYYVRQTHAFGPCLADAETLRTQWLKGRALTTGDIRRFERHQDQRDLLDAIERGDV